MSEISGIVFYPKDSSLFAIKDEAGILYKIFLTKENVISHWRFDKKRDFEDLVMLDSVFYVLVSNGDIETIQFGKDNAVTTSLITFPDEYKSKSEFESMYYDDSLKQLILVCKDCNKNAEDSVAVWGYSLETKKYTSMSSVINISPVSDPKDAKLIKLRPSAAAINPVTNELYIVNSINKLLVITDRNGKLIATHELDPDLYLQPEGIAFTPWGDLIITNEFVDNVSANVLVIKNKKKGL